MPLSINVGLSRKASKDYQSTGVFLNLVSELPQELLSRPEELQARIDDLFHQVEDAVNRHAGAPASARAPARRTASNGNASRTTGNGRYVRNGNGTRANGNGGAMTESQRRAILAIAKRANIDPEAEALDVIGAGIDELTLRQASELIDHLKGIEPAGNGR